MGSYCIWDHITIYCIIGIGVAQKRIFAKFDMRNFCVKAEKTEYISICDTYHM